MPRFKCSNRDQLGLIAINLAEQLQSGTFEYALDYLVDHKLDLNVFHQYYNNERVGRVAYDPAILLKIILFAYSKGITSTREIQWCCEHNIIFKALSCDQVPHFTTIADFVSRHPEAMTETFEQILLICDQQGLLGKELFAIDGCKTSSNAAKEWSGTFKELTEKRDKIHCSIRHLLAEHQRNDRLENLDEQRLQREQQMIATLNKSANKIDDFLKVSTPRLGKGKRPTEVKSNITDNESAKMTTSKGTIQGYNGVATVDQKHQVIVDAQAFGEGQEHHTLAPVLETVEERFRRLGMQDDLYATGMVITADTGFANEANMQYLHTNNINAYIPDNRFRSRDPRFAEQKSKYGKRHQDNKQKPEDRHITASEFCFDPTTNTCICPAGESLTYHGRSTGDNGRILARFEGRLLQCRQCSLKQRCMRNPNAADDRTGKGRQVAFTVRKPLTQPYTRWMMQRIDSPEGNQIYSQRMSVVEPVFGNIGSNKRLNRFSLRGRHKVQGQWQLFCLVHNIEKLANYGAIT